MEELRPPAPLLVIICGKPATGKTTLGRRLAADLGLPFFSKDGVKETLFDALGVGNRAWSRRLGGASLATLRYITGTLLAAGQSLIVEANLHAEQDAPFYQSVAAQHGARVAQVWLTAEPGVILRRFERRAASGVRHPGHVELANMEEFRATLLRSDDAPLPLVGALCVVDTTDVAAVEYNTILHALRMAWDGATGPDQPS